MGLETALLVGSIGMSVAGGVQQYQQGRAMAKSEKARFEANKQIAEQKADVEKSRLKTQQLKQMGSSIVSAASSGAGIQNFSELFQEDLEEKAMDMALVDYNAAIDIENMRFQSELNADKYKAEGTAGLVSGLSSAAMTGFSGFSGGQDMGQVRTGKVPSRIAAKPTYRGA